MCELEMLSTSQIIHLWELWNPTFWSVVSFFFFSWPIFYVVLQTFST